MQQVEQQAVWPPLPAGPPPPHYPQQPYEPPRYDQQPPAAAAAPWQRAGGFLAPPHGQAPEPQQQQKRKKRGKRGSGLEARQRGLKRQQQQPPPQTALGFFGHVPAGQQNVPASLQDLRRENRARAAQHFGGGGGGRSQQHGPGRSGGHRRSRGGKASKLPKRLAPTPRPMPLTPAAGNPLDTPANVGHAANATGGADRLEAEGLQAGLDWYGTNENSAALFLAGQQLTTSDSEFEDDWGALEEGEAAPQGNGHAHDDAHSGGSGSGGSGGGGEAGGGDAEPGGGAPGGALYDEAALPRAVRARLVEQEAYIAELEDQNLRLREQLDMLQQEVDELRGQRHAADSEEGFAEHSEGSLPADLSVMNGHPPQQH